MATCMVVASGAGEPDRDSSMSRSDRTTRTERVAHHERARMSGALVISSAMIRIRDWRS